MTSLRPTATWRTTKPPGSWSWCPSHQVPKRGSGSLKVQLQEDQPVAQWRRRVIVRLHLGEAEAPVQRQRLGLPDTGVEIHAGVGLAAGGADQFGAQRPPYPASPGGRADEHAFHLARLITNAPQGRAPRRR